MCTALLLAPTQNYFDTIQWKGIANALRLTICAITTLPGVHQTLPLLHSGIKPTEIDVVWVQRPIFIGKLLRQKLRMHSSSGENALGAFDRNRVDM